MNKVDRSAVAKILLVEDDPDDVKLTKRALDKSKLTVQLDVVDSGKDALKYLKRQDVYWNIDFPDLVLLDLNLPGLDGFGVLKEIRSDKNIRKIPVVILTTSKSEEDVAKCYDSNANCYINKPVDLDRFAEVVHKIEEFWFTFAELPKLSG